MTLDQSTLYNKFHILSIGLRRIEHLIYDKSKIGYKIDTFIVGDEVYDTLKKLITELSSFYIFLLKFKFLLLVQIVLNPPSSPFNKGGDRGIC